MWNSLKDLIAKRANTSSWKHQVDVAQGIEEARVILTELLPAELTGEFSVLYIRDNTITIRVSHPSIAQIIQQQALQILSQMPKELGIRKIQTVIGINPTE